MTNRSVESLNNLAKDTQLVSDRTGILIYIYFFVRKKVLCMVTKNMIVYFANDKILTQLTQKCGREVITGYMFRMWERKGEELQGQRHWELLPSWAFPSLDFFSTSLSKWAVFAQIGFSEK